MRNIMSYKGFVGSVYYSPADECFHGRIEGIDDLVSFEGRSADELKQRFHEAVDDYLELCRTAGKMAERSYSGSFNIRISPDLHRRAAVKSSYEGISLNQLVRRALEREVHLKSQGTPRGPVGAARPGGEADASVDAMVKEIYAARAKSRDRKPQF